MILPSHFNKIPCVRLALFAESFTADVALSFAIMVQRQHRRFVVTNVHVLRNSTQTLNK